MATPSTGTATKSATLENLVIRASAGTGKTYRLTNRFLGLLARGVGCDQILATTFTRKAAGEIFDRVLQRLAIAASDGKRAKELAQAIEFESLDQAQALVMLRELTSRLHSLRIGTLDSYFIQIASSLALRTRVATRLANCRFCR
ncbi:MAG: UvrD-helicase domain-containing protein [Pirellulales bacterium]